MTVSYEPNVPHLALPLQIGPTGSFNVVQQDTQAEVEQSVGVLLGTSKGQRIVVPDYGVPDPTFTEPVPEEITQAISQWEPRAVPTVSVTQGADGNAYVNVQVALAAQTS